MLKDKTFRPVSTTMPARSTPFALFIVILGALGALNPLSIDASLPTLPAIGRALHAPDAALQATLGGFMFAFALGQLVHGPLSDRFGRRPVALAGLALYTVTGLICTLAPNITILVFARIVQGFGAAAGMVIARAVARDIASSGSQAARLQAYVSAVFSLAPVVAPLLGAALLPFGWRAIYSVLTLAGAALLIVNLLALPETLTQQARQQEASIAVAYQRFLRLPRSLPLTLLVGVAFAGYFSFISGSPFVLQGQFGLPGGTYAIVFTSAALFLLAGSLLAGRLASSLSAEGLLAQGAIGIGIVGVAAFVLDVLLPHPTVVTFVVGMSLFALLFGIAIPNAFALGLQDAGAVASTGAAVLGAAQMLGGSAGSTMIGLLPFSPLAAVGIVVAFTGLVTVVAYAFSIYSDKILERM